MAVKEKARKEELQSDFEIVTPKEKSKMTEVKKEVVKKNAKKSNSSGKKVGIFKRIKNWFKSVGKEVKTVRWPNKKEMWKYSVATIVFVLFFAVFFLLIELLVSFLLNYFG